MNRYLAALLILFLALPAQSAHILFNLQDFVQDVLSVKQVKMTPTTMPDVNGTSIVTRDTKTKQTTTGGSVTFSNVVEGTYRVDVTGPTLLTTFSITVTNTSDLLNAVDLISVSTNSPAGEVGYSQASADGRFLRNIIYTNGTAASTQSFLNFVYGTNMAIRTTNNATTGRTDVYLSSSASGGGGGGSSITVSPTFGVLASDVLYAPSSISLTNQTNSGHTTFGGLVTNKTAVYFQGAISAGEATFGDTVTMSGNLNVAGRLLASTNINGIGTNAFKWLFVTNTTEMHGKVTVRSTLDDALDTDVIYVYNTDDDAANNSTMLRLAHNDSADANVFYAIFAGDEEGAPEVDYSFSQTAFTVGPGIITTFPGPLNASGNSRFAGGTNTGAWRFIGEATFDTNVVILRTNTMAYGRITEGATAGYILEAIDSSGNLRFIPPTAISGSNYVVVNNGYATNLTGIGTFNFSDILVWDNSNVNASNLWGFQGGLTMGAASSAQAPFTIESGGSLIADGPVTINGALTYDPVQVSGSIIDAAGGPKQFAVLDANKTYTLSNFTAGRVVHFTVTNPAAYTVEITGLNATNYNSAVGLPVATTNGMSDYFFWVEGGRTNARFVGKDLQFLYGSGLSATTNGYSVTLSAVLAGSDSTAIHDDVSGEIVLVTLKGTPLAADFLLIEDSAASHAKKSITIGGMETALEGVMDLQDLQGAITDSQAASTFTRDSEIPRWMFSTNGTTVGVQTQLNLIIGTNMVIVATNNTSATRIDLHISSAASGGGDGIAKNVGSGTNTTFYGSITNLSTNGSAVYKSTFNTWFPDTHNGATHLPYSLGYNVFANGNGSVSNYVWFSGLNPNLDGNPVLAGQPSFYEVWEDNYSPDASDDFIEWYLRTAADLRPIMVVVNKTSGAYTPTLAGAWALGNANRTTNYIQFGTEGANSGFHSVLGALTISGTNASGVGARPFIALNDRGYQYFHNTDESVSYFLGGHSDEKSFGIFGDGAGATNVIITNFSSGPMILQIPRGGLEIGPGSATVTNTLTATASLNFPDTAAQTHSDLPITVTGTTTNDVPNVAWPWQVQMDGGSYSCFPSNDTVWVRFVNSASTARNPAAGTFRAIVTKVR
jgi:hypothetical protein